MAALSKFESGDAKPKGGSFRSVVRVFREFMESSEKRRLALAIIALILSSSTNLAFPTIMGKAIDYSTRPEHAPKLQVLVAAVAAVFGVGALASFVRVYAFKTTSHSVEQKIRRKLFHTLLLQESEFFSTARLGELHSRLLQDVNISSKAVTENIAHVLRGLNSSIGGTAMLLLLSPRLTMVTLSLVPILGIGAILYSKNAKRHTKELEDATSKVCGEAEERIHNIETVRLFAMEESETTRFSNKSQSLLPLVTRSAAFEGLMMSSISIAVNTSLLAVLYFGGSLVRKGSLSVGNLASFALYSSMVGLGCSSLAKVYGDVTKASVAIDRLYETLDRPHPSISEGIMLPKVAGDIEFREVEFTYQCRPTTKVIQGLNLKVSPGQVVALAGTSGSGKTTTCKLLTRLLEPTGGEIFLDGHKLSELNPSWLRESVFAVVSQDPVLFDLSIAENIRYGRPGASDEEVIMAAEQANVAEFVATLPDGYETRVGERGVQLSGGQKQRLAIARAVLKNTPCLILDEATSSLDGESERLVQSALERLMKGRTVVMIAHRLSTLAYSERIEVMQEGRIVEAGSFVELTKKKGGVFATLSNSPKNSQ